MGFKQLNTRMQTNLLSTDSNLESLKHFEQSYEAFIDSFSGASGGVIASLIFYPIENFRTRVQAMQHKLKSD